MRRRNRLSRSRDFDAVYRRGRSVSTRYLVLYAFPRDRDGDLGEEPRLGLAVSKKVGGSVERTRLKRQLRAAFDGIAAGVAPGRDHVLIVRPGLAETAESRGFDWLVERVREVFDQTPRAADEASA
jgi:ribonuclease P protein component